MKGILALLAVLSLSRSAVRFRDRMDGTEMGLSSSALLRLLTGNWSVFDEHGQIVREGRWFPVSYSGGGTISINGISCRIIDIQFSERANILVFSCASGISEFRGGWWLVRFRGTNAAELAKYYPPEARTGRERYFPSMKMIRLSSRTRTLLAPWK